MKASQDATYPQALADLKPENSREFKICITTQVAAPAITSSAAGDGECIYDTYTLGYGQAARIQKAAAVAHEPRFKISMLH